MNKRDYLLDQIGKKANDFQKESTKHKNLYRSLRYTVFSLTACSTVLAGVALWQPEHHTTINLLIVLVTAAVGILTSIEGLRKPSELWIHERTTYYALLDLQREVEYKTTDNSDDKTLDLYFSQMQELLGTSGEKWNRFVSRTGQAPADSSPGANGETPP